MKTQKFVVIVTDTDTKVRKFLSKHANRKTAYLHNAARFDDIEIAQARASQFKFGKVIAC